jgi:phosphatidylinositol-3-phosphatase
MSHVRGLRVLGMAAFFVMFGLSARAEHIKTVFVIAMENHDWTQPANQFSGGIQQIFKNPNAPFINCIVSGMQGGFPQRSCVRISRQVAYATAYHNVLATPSGNNPHIHPSEPNYLWSEAGTNFGVLNDNDPFAASGPTNQDTDLHLTGFLMLAGKTWRSYQEDIDLTPTTTGLTNVPLPRDQWTVPLKSFSGNFVSGVNAYNGSTQYNYAAKHNPQVFFSDTNGTVDGVPNFTSSNPLSTHYEPLQQLEEDLEHDRVADYNWITPDQYNDMHTALTGGFQGKTGDAANIAQGDNFLSIVVPMIMASRAYQDHGAIVIWWDESESDGVTGDNADDFNHTIGEIVISPDAHWNNGVPYASPVDFSHSSDLRTWEELFHLHPFLGDAANANDLSDLFEPGVIKGPDDDDHGHFFDWQ